MAILSLRFFSLMKTLHGMKPECNDVPWDNVFIIFLTLCMALQSF